MNATVRRWGWVLAPVLVLGAALSLRAAPASRALDPLVITVTSAGDSQVEGESECPSADLCTLRRAVELANATPVEAGEDSDSAEPPPEAVRIVFDPAVFPKDEPVTITLLDEALPALTRPDVHIAGSDAGVVVDGSDLGDGGEYGMFLAGDTQSIAGVDIEHFAGTCLRIVADDVTVGGDHGAGDGLAIGDCDVGIDVIGDRVRIHGVTIAPDDAMAVTTGIALTGADGVIGADDEHPWPNSVGVAETGIHLGGALTAGTLIAGNRFGSHEEPAIEYGIAILPPAHGVRVSNNTFEHLEKTAILAAFAAEDAPNDGHTFAGNIFEDVGGAIDLGPADGRANGDIAAPVITHATTSLIQGTTCGGCTVELYHVNHVPGGNGDRPTTPIMVLTANGSGTFAAEVPGLNNGDWLSAITTGDDGSTSEFGPPERVGTGAVECGATELVAGWNHAAFFGPNGTVLGDTFPASGPDAGKITAIYKLIDGTSSFQRWSAEAPFANTLATLEPGESYFFFAEAPLTLEGGFSLAVPYPVSLARGWNDFVYIGASGDYRDALGEARTVVSNVYRFLKAGGRARWEQTGEGDTPAWARDFTEIAACETYQAYTTAPATLMPLQP